MRVVYFLLLTITTNLIWNCGGEEQGESHISLQCTAYAAILVPEPSAPKPTWPDKLPVNEGSGPNAMAASETLYLPTLCHLIQSFQKTQRLFTLPPSAGQQESKGACLYHSTICVLPSGPARGGSYSLLWCLLAREELYREHAGLVVSWEKGVSGYWGCLLTQAQEDHCCNLKPTNEIKFIKKQKTKKTPPRLAKSP